MVLLLVLPIILHNICHTSSFIIYQIIIYVISYYLLKESVENVKGLTNNSKSPGSKATQFRSSYLGFTVNFDHAEENSITSNAKDEEIGEEFQVSVLYKECIDQINIQSVNLISTAQLGNTINSAGTNTGQPSLV